MNEEVPLSDVALRRQFADQLLWLDNSARRGDEDVRWLFRCAEALYWQLKESLDFEDFGNADARHVNALHAQDRRNITRLIRRQGNSAFEILKCECLYINGASEFVMLEAWNREGLSVVVPVLGGREEVCVDGLWSRVDFLIMEPVLGNSLDSIDEIENNNECWATSVPRLVESMTPFHRSGVRIAQEQSWASAWFVYLEAASRYVASDHPQLKWEVPFGSYERWRERTEDLGTGEVLLHGNFRSANALVEYDTGRLVLHAPLGGIVSRREFEIGNTCALEISDPADLPAALETAFATDLQVSGDLPVLDTDIAAYAAGLIAVFRASNSLMTGVNEHHEDPFVGARSWLNFARDALVS